MKKLADEIADYLFTNGAQKKARRLVLEMGDGSNGGGWGHEPLRDAVQRYLDEAERERNTAARLTILNASDLLMVLGAAMREQDFSLVTPELAQRLQDSVDRLRPLINWK